MPRWCIGWDVLCWLGHRRFARHWPVPQLRLELKDTHQIRVSDDAIARYIGLYQTMLAARQQDPERWAEKLTPLVIQAESRVCSEFASISQVKIRQWVSSVRMLMPSFTTGQFFTSK
jgi:hypothetical protein